jgi:hypothetical protein
MKEWKKIIHINEIQKKGSTAILTLHKMLFKSKAIKSDKEGHYIMIKGSI